MAFTNALNLTAANPLSLAQGGLNASLTASNGGIFYSTSTAGAILAGTATANQLLMSGAAGAPSWSAAVYPSTVSINSILYASSADVVGELSTVNNAVLSTSATGVPTWVALDANGEILIGSSSGAPAAATLTAGSGISITNGANSITIAATVAGMTYNAPTSGATVTMSVNNAYTANATGGVTFTLPSTFALGSLFQVAAKNADGWTVAQPAGVSIQIGSVSTTAGTGGSLASTAIGDVVYMYADVANTHLIASCVMGNITYV